jgi:hypothetical protein
VTPPSGLGGLAKCGSGKQNNIDLVECAWADQTGIGVVVFFNRTATSSTTTLFNKIRAQLEK